MNAQQIADRLVERGIGEKDGTLYVIPRDYFRLVTAEVFISDWRTAGACMEANKEPVTILPFDDGAFGVVFGNDNTATGESLPAAICEAFAEVET